MSTLDLQNPIPLICFCTAPSMDVAEHIANTVIEQQLAACVSFLPGAISVYRWKDQVCRDGEVWVMIKTTSQMYAKLQSVWCDMHPYEVPELLAVSAVEGFPPYVSWLLAQVGTSLPSAAQ